MFAPDSSPRAQINFNTMLVGQTAMPLVACLCIFVFYFAKRFKIGRKEKKKVRELGDQCAGLFLFITYFVFPSTSCSILKYYACNDDFDDGESYLKVDYSISCVESSYKVMAWGYCALMILIYPIGIPLLCACPFPPIWPARVFLHDTRYVPAASPQHRSHACVQGSP